MITGFCWKIWWKETTWKTKAWMGGYF